MLTINQLNLELDYNPETGELVRKKSLKPVYLERTPSGPRMEIRGYRLSARKVVLALLLGRFPEKLEYRHMADDPMDLRASAFKLSRRHGRKDCARCGKDFELTEFHKNPQRKDKRGSYCKNCVRELSADRHKKTYFEKYGLTAEQYEKMAEEQNHQCKVCGQPAENERYKKLSIDHCHKTKEVRGLLCSMCNTGLGMFKDDPVKLLNAAKYLLKKL